MIKAASLSTDINLLTLSQLLRSQGLQHRINEESGQQVIWVATAEEAEIVRSALEKWQTADAELISGIERAHSKSTQASAQTGYKQLTNKAIAAAFYYPVTSGLFAVCVVVALISSLGSQPGDVSFLFYPTLSTEGWLSLLSGIQTPIIFLQTLTPMFLHFGELHLVFNMLWLWYFGRQLESIHRTWRYAGLVLVMAFISNSTQYLMAGANNFGGMSGVVYGLVGYTWAIHTLMPNSYLSLNGNMFVFFVIALVLMEFFASSMIATGAHIGGLVSGLLIGLLVVAFQRLVLQKTAVGHKPFSN